MDTERHTTLDIEFRNLSYSVAVPKHRLKCTGRKKAEVVETRTQILRELSGSFRAGELTAVLGPSGAGKTSLLTILAGFRSSGVRGEVLLNGRPRDAALQASSRRLCCLIPQDFAMLDALTVGETLNVAAQLKLGHSTSRTERDKKVRDTSTLLGLDGCFNTAVAKLSGGEKKRVSCGVELLSNPPLMFFDEPTSGLDACSAHQVLSHLRGLAHRDRRNIVCSIHQPGSRLFQSFDSVFVLARGGRCVLKGSREKMVSTLTESGFQCPQFYNPADYVLEVASGERGDTAALLVLAAAPDVCVNEKELAALNDNGAEQTVALIMDDVVVEKLPVTSVVRSLCPRAPLRSSAPACSTWQQFSILLSRATRCGFRDLHMAWLRSAAHVFVGVMLGLIFYQIGDDAARVTSNVGCVFFLMLFLFFSNAMPTVLTFPAEMAVMLREHLNGWYSVTAYYMARSIADLPLQLFCPSVFLLLSYFMSGQPLEPRPFLQLWAVALLLTLVAQSLGLLVGAASDVKMGIFLVPVISIPMLLFSGHFVQIHDIPSYLRWISYLSVFRYAFEASLIALYGFGRATLPCSQDFCPVRAPEKILQELRLDDERFSTCIAALVTYVIVLQVLLCITLKLRVRASK